MIRSPFIKGKYPHELRSMEATTPFGFGEGSDIWTSPCGWFQNDLPSIVETIKSCQWICISESFSGGGFCIDWHLLFLRIHLVLRKLSSLDVLLYSQVFLYAVRWIICIFCFHPHPIHSYCKSLFLSFSSWFFVALRPVDLDGSHCHPLGTWTNTLAFTLLIIMA